MKFKVGDKVKVRSDLEIDEYYGEEEFVSDMEEFKGKTVTIDYVFDDGYYIIEDANMYVWTDEMLYPIEDEKRIDNTTKENPITKQQYNELKKKYDELENNYRDLENDYKYLDGYVDAVKWIIETLKGEN